MDICALRNRFRKSRSAPDPEAAVVIDGAEFRYGKVPALRGVSFSIPKGAVAVVLGSNGSGKSTLLHGIAGLTRPHSGTVSVVGSGQRRAAYVLQNTSVNRSLPLTLEEVVRMGRYSGMAAGPYRAADRTAVSEAMRRTGVTHLARRPFSHLSGGEKQRALLAQGLSAQPKLLLLDEPTTGLDVASVERIRRVIAEEKRLGNTTVMTSHNLDEARESDFVILLAGGRVVAAAAPGKTLTAANLAVAYGQTSEHVDDPCHEQNPVHFHERSIHLETDPAAVHGD